MAGIPLNTFKTVTFKPTTEEKVVYVANTGLTSIVLMAQAAVSNTTASFGTITFKHWRSAGGANPIAGGVPNGADTFTTILIDAVIPPHDALVLLGGKLVLETFDYITLQADQNDKIEFISSILETANQ